MLRLSHHALLNIDQLLVREANRTVPDQVTPDHTSFSGYVGFCRRLLRSDHHARISSVQWLSLSQALERAT